MTTWTAGLAVRAVAAATLVLTACSTADPGLLSDGSGASVSLDGVTAIAPVPAAAPSREGLQDALDAVAAGFFARDPEAIRPWLYDPDSDFGQRWLARATNLAEVPLSHYALVLDDSLPDLAPAAVREAFGATTQVVYVREEHALTGFDDNGPASEDLFLTVVETDDGWRVVGDRHAESLGLVSVDHLWDHGPVVVSGDGPIVALHHPGTPSVDAVLAEARVALDNVVQRWPLDWSQTVPLIIPRDEEELGELLHVTFDLSSFVAFATATPTGELGDYELTGSRVVINPPRFLNRSSETRRLILEHELLHIATRPETGPFVPSWVEEGVAQRLGEERSTTGLRLLSSLVSRGGFAGELPDDSDFITGGNDRIFLSYQTSFSFLDYLVDRYGRDTVAAFYADVGRGAVGLAGREAWHVDRAATATFGTDLAGLRAGWVERLRAG